MSACNLLIRQIGTRAWWAQVLCEVPEPTKLGYFTKYPATKYGTVLGGRKLLLLLLFFD